MKKQITVEQSFCDVCGKEATGHDNCDVCGKEFCRECIDAETIRYSHGVHCSGSGDGVYCHECDQKMRNNGDKLHTAYRKIAALRNELLGWSQDFDKRKKQAESEVSDLVNRREEI